MSADEGGQRRLLLGTLQDIPALLISKHPENPIPTPLLTVQDGEAWHTDRGTAFPG